MFGKKKNKGEAKPAPKRAPKNDPKPTPPQSTFETFSPDALVNAGPRGAALFMEVNRGDQRARERYEEELREWRKRNPGCE